ncbi:MAG: hypothetical protein RIQ60_2745 [Pseudomonadota bacterium]|jgi:acetyl esterase/lipase
MTRSKPLQQLDLAYADQSPAQKLDLYLPDGEPPSAGWPTVIYIHGGGWAWGDKADERLSTPLSWRARGWAVAALNYRLTGEAGFPAQIFDVKAAVRLLRANAARWQLDPARFAAWGCSAGGHLAALLGASNDVSVLEDLGQGCPDASSAVQAVVDFYGPTQLDLMDTYLRQTGLGRADHLEPGSPESRLLGGVPTDRPGEVIAANPETWVTRLCPPFMLIHAAGDPIVPVQHSVLLAQRITLMAGASRVRLLLVEQAGHATPEFDAPALLDQVADFLDQSLPARSD